ncbi:MAG: LLM class flavin-dependent oxidoreductase, partial [Halioglobus sp.]|nr:LLM class flavin-dependent oxidoreductase [Halioglobus sp.]
ARRAERMLLNMVTPDSLARLRAELAAAAAAAGKPTPQVAVWLSCAVDPAPEAIQQLLRAMVGYLAAPGYAEMFIEAGFSDLVRLARSRPHPGELLAAMPDELVAAVGLVGTEAAIARRLEQYRAAGADEICLVPATAGDPAGARTLAAMARYLAGG